MSEETVGGGPPTPPPQWSATESEDSGYVPRPPGSRSQLPPSATGQPGGTPPPSGDELTPEDIEFNKAYAIVAEYDKADFDSLPQKDKDRLSANIAIVVKYTNTQARYANLVDPSNPYTNPLEVSKALGGTIMDVNLLTSLRLNRPILPKAMDISGTSLPADLNEWFTSSARFNLLLAALDLAKVNRDAALQLNLMEAFLTTVFIAAKEDEANYANKIYQKQAEQAMWEMIGACVSLTVTAAGMATTVGMAGAGGIKGLKSSSKPEVTERTMSVGPDGKEKMTSFKQGPDRSSSRAIRGLKGAGSGATASDLVVRQLTAAGGPLGQIISSLGKMMTLEDLGQLERSKILVQAAADMIKKAMDSCSEEAKEKLRHNDELYQFLKSSDERARLFGSITAH